jgi:hypothetical protein
MTLVDVLALLLPKILKLFGFSTFELWPYLMKVTVRTTLDVYFFITFQFQRHNTI